MRFSLSVHVHGLGSPNRPNSEICRVVSLRIWTKNWPRYAQIYPSSHNHGTEKWPCCERQSFTNRISSTSMILAESPNACDSCLILSTELMIQDRGHLWEIKQFKQWDTFWGNQTMQIYGNFEGLPLYLCRNPAPLKAGVSYLVLKSQESIFGDPSSHRNSWLFGGHA